MSRLLVAAHRLWHTAPTFGLREKSPRTTSQIVFEICIFARLPSRSLPAKSTMCSRVSRPHLNRDKVAVVRNGAHAPEQAHASLRGLVGIFLPADMDRGHLGDFMRSEEKASEGDYRDHSEI